ncbi:MFS transporter [Halobium salinum]|uniref:MFS transporter n=1 Tax=Halobium salinum TaxID=1364940 RepID=A0ABD5PB08_9EURY|nr:MFS transporter [Halobium salinum]
MTDRPDRGQGAGADGEPGEDPGFDAETGTATPTATGPGVLDVFRGDGRGPTILLVGLGWFLVLGLRYLVPALLPQIKAGFGLGNAAAGFAVTVIWVAYALMQFPAGSAVGRVGERALLAVSLAAAGASLVAIGLAPTFLVFLVGVALFGLGTGLFGPPRGTLLSRTFAPNDGAAIGVVLAAGSVGSAALPFLAGLLVDDLGWRVTVAATAPFFLVVAVGTWRLVPARERSPDTDGGSTLPAVADLRRALSRRSVLVGVPAITLLLFVMQGLTAFLPTYLIEVKGLSQETASGLFALLFLSGAVAQSAGGSLADRYGDRPVLLASTLLGTAPLAALPYVSGLLPLTAITLLLGVRLGINAVSNSYLIAVLPRDVQGPAWGLLRTVFFVLGATGSVFVGVFADRGLFALAFLVLAALSVVAAGLYLFLPARGR